MVEGWGDDFDEDGNVIGEVPESDAGSGFVQEHWKAVAVVSLVVFLLNFPRVAPTTGLAGLAGLAIGSFLLGIPLAYVAVKLRNL